MAGCGCNGSAGTGDLWVNVKGDGTPTQPMSKADAQASVKIHGGFLRKA